MVLNLVGDTLRNYLGKSNTITSIHCCIQHKLRVAPFEKLYDRIIKGVFIFVDSILAHFEVTTVMWSWSRTRSGRFESSARNLGQLKTLRVEELMHNKLVVAQSPPIGEVWKF
ncbi:hypothetical protein TNCV_4792571 [Trichonephila clavipes]|nr:hypothetical protein TNCV_4792571 [Trichonephila clavipes]